MVSIYVIVNDRRYESTLGAAVIMSESIATLVLPFQGLCNPVVASEKLSEYNPGNPASTK